MLIQFERTGGIAGMRAAATVDTESLPQEEARKLREMVDASDFFNLPAKFPAPERGADYFLYRITVDDGGRKHTVEVSEPSVPAQMRPLIKSLTAYSRK